MTKIRLKTDINSLFEVYGVKEIDNQYREYSKWNIQFLIYNNDDWQWVNAKYYEPINS